VNDAVEALGLTLVVIALIAAVAWSVDRQREQEFRMMQAGQCEVFVDHSWVWRPCATAVSKSDSSSGGTK
jgi:hypothetical protein